MIGDEFVRSFNRVSLSHELEIVKKVLSRPHSRESIPWAFNLLDAIHADSSTFSLPAHLAAYPLYRTAINTLRSYAADFDVFRNLCCQRVMIAESYIPQRLRQEVYARCIELYTSPNISQASTAPDLASTPDPITRLALDTYKKCYMRQEFSLSSHDYFPDLESLVYTGYLELYPREDLRYYEQVADVTCSAIAEWFQFPTSTEFHVRAYLVKCIVDNLGHSALLLPGTWTVYEELPSWLFDGNYRIRSKTQPQTKFRPDMMQSLQIELENSEATQAGSTVHQLLRLLGLHYKTYMLQSKV